MILRYCLETSVRSEQTAVPLFGATSSVVLQTTWRHHRQGLLQVPVAHCTEHRIFSHSGQERPHGIATAHHSAPVPRSRLDPKMDHIPVRDQHTRGENILPSVAVSPRNHLFCPANDGPISCVLNVWGSILCSTRSASPGAQYTMPCEESDPPKYFDCPR